MTDLSTLTARQLAALFSVAAAVRMSSDEPDARYHAAERLLDICRELTSRGLDVRSALVGGAPGPGPVAEPAADAWSHVPAALPASLRRELPSQLPAGPAAPAG